MNKHIQIPVEIEVVKRLDHVVLLFLFHRDAVHDWVLSLSLLKEGLIDVLVVTEDRRRRSAKIRLQDCQKKVGERVLISLKADKIQIELTRNSLDFMQHFFLKYYRDGIAEVEHLDLQAIDADTGNRELYFTLKVPDFAPPVSPEEAERLLRD
jgi:hypothetical protein